jgi:hypothetical protein
LIAYYKAVGLSAQAGEEYDEEISYVDMLLGWI